MAEFTIYRDNAGEYRWRLTANNNKTTADSGEGYKTNQGCRDAIDRVKREVAVATIRDTSR
jgi:uncharacterized protein YegP (UPF0339 family)